MELGPPSPTTSESRPGTPVGELPSSMPVFSFHSDSIRSSRTRSRSISNASDFTSSDSSSILGDGNISIKVVHNKSIILLRVYRYISLPELRAKIYDKFVQQEGVPLSASFGIAFLPPSSIDLGRSRSSSISSAGFPELAQMRFLSSQNDLERAIMTTGRGKLVLRAIGDQGV